MKKLFISVLLVPLLAFSCPQEKPIKNNAKIWFENDKWWIESEGHLYTFDYPIHDEHCKCEWWKYDY